MNATPYRQPPVQYEEAPDMSVIEGTNKKSVLNVLDYITIFSQKTFKHMLKLKFEGVHDQNMIEDMEHYVAWIIALYEMLKPKISGTEHPKIYETLTEITDFENDVIESPEPKNEDELIKIYKIFVGKMRLLRDLCEELRYTTDEEDTGRVTGGN